MNKEKKHVSENSAKASDDLLTAQEKVDHLNKIKCKLEQTLDELESSLSREKRQRAQIEKERRHVEGDLKVTQEMVLDLERTRKEMEGVIQRKEKDISGLFVKLEDEQSLVAKVQKHIKENQSRYSPGKSASLSPNHESPVKRRVLIEYKSLLFVHSCIEKWL
jgi:chromosome segregation ATPase